MQMESPSRDGRHSRKTLKRVLATLVAGAAIGVAVPAVATANPSEAATSQPTTCAPPSPQPFASCALHGLDLNGYAKQRYGSTARVTLVSESLTGWRLDVPNGNGGRRVIPVNFADLVRWQYGPDFAAVAVGGHAYDWKALDLSSGLQGWILPVLSVPQDRMNDRVAIDRALTNYRDVLTDFYTAVPWLRSYAPTSRLVTPVVVPSGLNDYYWDSFMWSELAVQEQQARDYPTRYWASTWLPDLARQDVIANLPQAANVLVSPLVSGQYDRLRWDVRNVGPDGIGVLPPAVTRCGMSCQTWAWDQRESAFEPAATVALAAAGVSPQAE